MVTYNHLTASLRVTKVIRAVKRFTATERLMLAKLLLDSLIVNEAEDDADWLKLSLATFEQDWDNAEDAMYDDIDKLRRT